MNVSATDLKKEILDEVIACDEAVIISGYFSPDMLNEIAKAGKKTTFYFGMVYNETISLSNSKLFKSLEATYPSFQIRIPALYHIHSKCYLFFLGGKLTSAYVGSANCSSSGLDTSANSEILVHITDPVFLAELEAYANDVQRDSVHYSDPAVYINSTVGKPLRTVSIRSASRPASWDKFSGNPFSAIIPLYYLKKGKATVHNVDGLNWGNGPHASKSPDMESVIPIRKFIIDHYPSLIPFNGPVGSGVGGKSTRMQSPFDVIWDDGTVMKMVFQQGGPQIPSPSKRAPGDPYRIYPKALTANSGGTELGVYLRNRMGLPTTKTITYKDLRTYGRDYVTLTLSNSGNYELDFHV